MATNVSYASDFTALEALILHTLPDFGPNGDGIINNNFLLAALRKNGMVRVTDGGLEFWKGLLTTENSNFKWQSNTDTMNAQLQDPAERLRYPIQTFTGALVVNKLFEAQNKGKAMVKNWVRTLREQSKTTISNQFNSAFWNTSPVSVEPNSIPGIISATPTAGTIGGLTRSSNAALQNEAFTAAVADIGSEAGITALKRRQVRNAIGGGGKDMVDVMITTDENYSGLVGYLATQNRFRPDDRFADLDMETIKLGKSTISFENTTVLGDANTIADNRVYGINSKHMFFDILRDGNFIWNPEGFERVGMTLNRALYFWVFCNLTTDLPRAHFVMTNVSTA